MIQSYEVKNYANQSKEEIFFHYKLFATKISKIFWQEFFDIRTKKESIEKYKKTSKDSFNDLKIEQKFNSKFNKMFDVKDIHSELSERYKQACRTQVAGQLTSYIENRKNDYIDVVKTLNIDKITKIQLYFINRYDLWFKNNVKMRNKMIPINIVRLGRRIIKNVLKSNSKPYFKNINIQLNANLVELQNLKIDKATKFEKWISMSTIKNGKKLMIPINMNAFINSKLGNFKKGIQINFNKLENKFTFVLVKDIVVSDYIPERESISLDFGLVEMFSKETGEFYGRGFNKKLYSYDEKLSKLGASLQKKGIKLNQSKKYRKLAKKIRDFLKNEVNRVLNSIIKNHKPVRILVEKLNFQGTKLSKRMNRILSKFGKAIITKKLEDLESKFNIIVEELNPAYTSQICNDCDYIAKENRKNQETFVCSFCGKSKNADTNASGNFEQRSSLFSLTTFSEEFGSYERRLEKLESVFVYEVYQGIDKYMKRSKVLEKQVSLFIERHIEEIREFLFLLEEVKAERQPVHIIYEHSMSVIIKNKYFKPFLERNGNGYLYK